MENASKALLMAAGVIIGLILLTLSVYLYSSLRNVEQAKANVLSEEQIVKFNQEFNSYNKSAMYGTDVISVINKALNNNGMYEDDDSMWINIEFKLATSVKYNVTLYKMDKETKKYISYDLTDGTHNSELAKYKKYIEGYKTYDEFTAGKSYSLIKNGEIIKNFLNPTNPAIKEKSGYRVDLPDTESVTIGKGAQKQSFTTYLIVYTGFSDFKRKIFKCTDVTNNSVNGKINYMKFEEIKITEGE